MLYVFFTLQGLLCSKICNFFKVNVLNLAEIPLVEKIHHLSHNAEHIERERRYNQQSKSLS